MAVGISDITIGDVLTFTDSENAVRLTSDGTPLWKCVRDIAHALHDEALAWMDAGVGADEREDFEDLNRLAGNLRRLGKRMHRREASKKYMGEQ